MASFFQPAPLHWNGVEIAAVGGKSDLVHLAEWAEKWMDAEEVGRPVEQGLLGAIHSVTVPEPTRDGFSFSVDFGSAPIEAVTELIRALVEGGAAELQFASTWGYHT